MIKPLNQIRSTSLVAVQIALLSGLVSLPCWAATEKNAMINCHIEAPQQVKVGQSLPLTFLLTNTSEDTLQILTWNTPLEGWFNDSFTVTRNGKAVNYIGAMVKRFRPSEQDYVTLKPQQITGQIVNLAAGYDLKTPGTYELTFKGQLHDVQRMLEDQPLAAERTAQSISCERLTVIVQQ